MSNVNPYAIEGDGRLNPNAGGGADRRYAVADPRDTDAPYADTFGIAPGLRTSPTGIPDAERIGVEPIRQRREDARHPDKWWDEGLDHDDARRHAVETQHTTIDRLRHPWGLFRAPDPRWIPVPTVRPTTEASPRSYDFTRPFMRPPVRNTGVHFSMADHRRNYDILGMSPVPSHRNTFRIEPTPWDADQYDVPPDVKPLTVPGRIQSVDVPLSHGGSYRLGG